MPGFDGTGPRGMGPMTGGGRGYCNPGGFGRGYGFSRGYGRGYGRGWGVPYPVAGQYPYYGAPADVMPGIGPYAPQMSREQELDFLKNEAEAAKEQLEQIDARIKAIETE